MKKLSISKVIEFSRKSEKSRSTFLKQHNKPKPPSKGGGDYWISCISAVNHAFKNDDNSLITDKIEYLIGEIKNTPHKITKDMFQRNVDILYNFEVFNFSKWISTVQLTFLSKKTENSVIQINNIPIQVKPNHVFTFDDNGKAKIGAISFVSKLEGYKQNELAAFVDANYRYLNINYSNKFTIEPSLCLAIDMTNLNELSYDDIICGNVISLLDNTITDIKKAA